MDNAGRWAVTVGRVWLGGVAYALVVASVVTAGALALGLATGGGFVRAKRLVFLAGWVLIGYGTLRLWPRSVEDLGGPVMGARGTRFERITWALPPIRWVRPAPPTERLRVATKVLLAGLAALLISLVMELRFGIG